MDQNEAQQALALLREVVGKARDEASMENWGPIWVIHAFFNGAAFCGTHQLIQFDQPLWTYVALWSGALFLNLLVIGHFKPQKGGTRTFIQKQIWLIWTGFILANGLAAVVQEIQGLNHDTYAPVIALNAAFAFAMMAGVIHRGWILASIWFTAVAIGMAVFSTHQFLVLGVGWGLCQFIGGITLIRARKQRLLAQPPTKVI